MESSCFQLTDSANKDVALFSGDTVFLGEVGRPDLACSENITSADLASMLYDSVQKIKKLEGSMRLYPGHGSGSACGKSIGAGNYCTVGAQNTNNYGFKFTNREDFVKELTANLPKPPKYFFYDAALNQKGSQVSYESTYKKAHVSLTEAEFLKLKDKFTLLDARSNPEEGFVKGAYWLPASGPLCNFISHFIAPDEEFIIICDMGKETEIINRLFRIGYFNIKGYNSFNMGHLKEV
jgi:hydroxyacylglutathione hydrolase